MPEPVAVTQRLVPGAPPPAPLSKTQKKRRKAKVKSDGPEDVQVIPDATTAALIEKAPEPADVQQGTLAPELVVQDSRAPSVFEEDSLLKNSPIVELVTKRFKATNKKITRITGYAAMDPEKLNDDQRRTLKTLPTLEAIQKELGEVKKAIEVHEAELAHELAAKRAEIDRAEKARILAAVAAAQSTILSKTGDILNLLRFRSSLANGEIDTSALSIQGAEATAVYSAADALLGEDGDRKLAVISGFLLAEGEGDVDGVPYSRLIEIATAALNPPRVPTPEPEEEHEPAVTAVTTDEVPSTGSITGPSESEAPVNITAGVPGSIAVSNSFRFMQDSELEGPFDETPADVPQEIVDAQEEHPLVEGEPDSEHAAPVNGHVEESPAPAVADPTSGTIDWAAEENAELPPIAPLQAEFGTSGSATPADITQQPHQEHTILVDGEAAPSTSPQPQVDDGFQPAGGRGHNHPHNRGRGGYRGGPDGERGRGRGGFRGGYRGHGERGGGPGGERGFRGGYRGGDRGGRGGFRGREYHGEGGREYRGEGGRGEYRGEGGRGEYRGEGGRGDYRGEGGRGGYRGDHRGDGERRGGGRGRGRGDYRGPPREGAPSGGTPPVAAAVPAAQPPAAA